MGLEPVCMHVSTLSNMNISGTSGPLAIKFYLKLHWDGGKAAIGFWPDRMRILVSMATDSSHSVVMGKTVSAFSLLFLIESFSYLHII